MGIKIDTVSARKALDPRPAPYFQRLEKGAYIGYRKLDEASGTWVARWRDEHGKQINHTLGCFDSFDQACKAAREWVKGAQGGVTEVVTVEEACRRYVEDRKVAKGAATATDAEGRFNRTIYGTKLGVLKLSALKTSHIIDWRNGIAALDDDDAEDPDEVRRAKDTANRYLATFKAALNLAYRSGLANDTAQWDRVETFKGVGKRRMRWLTISERKKLILAAPKALQTFMKALLHTGARPGELANCYVGDFDKAGVLTLDGKTGRRTVPVSPEAAKLLAASAGTRPDDEALLVRADGKAWTRFDWRDGIQDARTTAALGDDVVAYTLRHVAITEMIVSGGIDPLSVARLAGTSVAMIERHYGHLRKDKVAAQLAKVKVL
ncbi:tyrosine-type recombinase/integrase [Nitrogeniibacter mangrovi]|uniref:Tyrosine-type recombinase/integrase n=1 Tax=Nitrogeniibacter mangrovi TaxID=2016596 RepID=A0A6C1B2G2_9RHOO|nr:tyrosine-type recombinase/integrase [Nitrogeniibacter mangrovi]QID17832.1 tyrosine-type recombinase/integrase [Nitrogeniibacter mangrovi]